MRTPTLIALLTCLAWTGAAAQERPNIVFILADDLGWADINIFDPLKRGFYETPNIDRLARQGVRFTHAYSNGANCAPTRAALMSGQVYPRQPVYHVNRPGKGRMIAAPNADVLPLEKVTLAEALRAGGYATGFIGKWHLGDPPESGPEQQGFDSNVGGYHAGNPRVWEGAYFQPNNNPFIDDARPGEYLTDYLTRKATAYIEANRARPFYLQLSYYTPHDPLQAPEERIAKYRRKRATGGHHEPTYAAMIESLDRGVGEVLAALERAGIAERTIVVFTSDNGGAGGYRDIGREENGITDNSPLKSGKGSFYEGGIRVPLVVRWPGVTPRGAVSTEPVISMDFYPTLLEATGVPRPSGYMLDGESMVPLLRRPASASLPRDLVWHYPGYPNSPWRTSPVTALRSGRWKLMRFYERDALEMYDLVADPGEERNLAAARPEIRDRLQARMTSWLKHFEAPMARWPEGAGATGSN